MKKTFITLMLAAICSLSLIFFGCKKEPDCIELPGPPCLHIEGTVTDETSQPIESILVTVDSLNLDMDKWTNYYVQEYSDKEGKCVFAYTYNWAIYDIEFPSAVILSAKDTSGIYETQTKTFPVARVKRVINLTSFTVYDGLVTADFVLKKK